MSKRLSVAQYDAMTRAGILGPDDRVELLEGWLVRKRTKNPPHRIATRRARVALERRVPAGWYVDSQEPIVTTDSEPEPDVAVIRGRTEDYVTANPGAAQVGLVVEVANATLLRDRRTKARVYARAGIPHYWIVNLVACTVEMYSEPTVADGEPAYGRVAGHDETAEVALMLDGVEVGRVPVSELLP